MRTRNIPETNASSMADMAFLLLIFFMVVTKISADKGISVTLPKWDSISATGKNTDLTMPIFINAKGEVMIFEKPINEYEVFQSVIDFLKNNLDATERMNSNYRVTLKYSTAISYSQYINVYDQILAGHTFIRNQVALDRFGKKFSELKDPIKIRQITSQIPIKIQEY